MVLSALHFEAPYLFAAFYPSLLSVHFFCWLKLGDKKKKKNAWTSVAHILVVV